jgi:hypothetical protein
MILSIGKCSVGQYMSGNLKFRMSDTFVSFQNLSQFGVFLLADFHCLQNVSHLEYAENDHDIDIDIY